jgi:cell division protein FtsB
MNITPIAIVALVAWAIVSIVRSFTDKSSKKMRDKEKVQLEAEIAALKERVEVLEKIVTDDSYTLRQEIDALNKNGKDEAA